MKNNKAKKVGLGILIAVLSLTTVGAGIFGIVKSKQASCEHEFGEGKVKVEATCEKDGEMIFECEKCGYDKKEKIEATGHDYGEDGKCTDCGEEEAADENTDEQTSAE